jgi:putative oxidoreductase
MRSAPLLGRMLMGVAFLASASNKIAHPAQSQAYMAEHGMKITGFFLVLAIAIEVLGALSLMLGLYARHGALLLAIFLAPTTVIFHSFWEYGAAEAPAQLTHFMKNLAIMGGLLLMCRSGAMNASLDRKLHTRDESPPSLRERSSQT